MDDEVRKIPFVKPARVGNFKVWRSKKNVGKGQYKTEIEQLNVSTIDEGWQVKIPASIEMFATISELYSAGRDAALMSIFTNMMCVMSINNGYYHQAVAMVSSIYADPLLLSRKDKRYKVLKNDIKALIKGFLEWRKMYEANVRENEPTDEDMRREEVLEEILSEIEDQENE